MALRFVVLAYDELLYEQTYESMSYFAGNLENKLSEIEKLAENNISNSIMQESLAELKEAEGWNSVRGTGICQIQREYMKCISD